MDKIEIKTSWDENVYKVTANLNGKFLIKIRTPKASFTPQEVAIKGKENTVFLKNILIGDIWICAGQSNMEMSAEKGVLDIKSELSVCKNNGIRFFRAVKNTSAYPQENLKAGAWNICDSASLAKFSAVGYFFGKKINQKVNIPIGLIDLSWGGTNIEAWIPKDSIQNNPAFAKSAQQINIVKVWSEYIGGIFNAEVFPLLKMSLTGILWYQGEANVQYPNTYYSLFKEMTESYRSLFNKDIPIYTVQIAPYFIKRDTTNIQASLIQEAQALAAKHIPKVGMVVTTDLVDNINDIHPKYKQQIGNRLANYALNEIYSIKTEAYKSPRFREMTVKKSTLIISFDYLEEGLIAKGENLLEFKIAGHDKIFYAAKAKIVGDKVEVFAEQVKNPVAVRFAFNNNAQPNLFEKNGLPVVPFRTDNW